MSTVAALCKICGERHRVTRGGCPKFATKSSRGSRESRPAGKIVSGVSEASVIPVTKLSAGQALKPEQGRGIVSGVAGRRSAGQQAGVAPGPREAKPKRSLPSEASTKPAKKLAGKPKNASGTATKSGGSPAPKRGRGRPKVTGPRPWEKEGLSRRTWYRYQKLMKEKSK